MTFSTARSAHLLAASSGLAMAAVAGFHSGAVAAVVATLAAVAVLVGIWFRIASMLAVLLAAAAVMLAEAGPLTAGLAGLAGACHLVLRCNVAQPILASRPALVAALGFTVVGASVTAVPLDLSWLPLLAPPAVLVAYLVSIRPFLAEALTTSCPPGQ
jgi:hypothetical protein